MTKKIKLKMYALQNRTVSFNHELPAWKSCSSSCQTAGL